MRWLRDRVAARPEPVSAVPVAPARGMLFVCGCPRSGTGGLLRLLNGHPGIALGCERYAFRARRHELDASLFEEDRFFAIQSGDTWYPDFATLDATARDEQINESFYAEVRRHWEHAAYRGDKVPRLYRWLAPVLDSFPEARVLFIVRDITAVSRSVQVRAEREPGKFWSQPGWAVTEWNTSLEIAMEHLDDPRFGVVDFEALFEQPADPRPIFSWLGLPDSDEASRRYDALSATRPENATPRPVVQLSAEVQADITERARMDLYERVRRAAIDVTPRSRPS